MSHSQYDQQITSRSGQSYLDDGVEMEPSQPSHDQNDSPAKNYYEDGSHLVSNLQTTRPISMAVSGPMSGNRMEDVDQEIVDRSAQAS